MKVIKTINIIPLTIFIIGCSLQSCSKKNVVIETSDPSGSLAVSSENLGAVSDVPEELIQQYVLASIDTIDADNYIFDKNSKDKLFVELKRFYRFNNYKLSWSTIDAPSADSKVLLNELLSAEEHGLSTNVYNIDLLLDLMDQTYDYSSEVNLADVLHLDIMLSAAYVTYAWHLYNGQIDSKNLGNKWLSSKENIKLAQYLAGKSVKEGIAMVEPQSTAYTNLRKKLDIYLSMADDGGWQQFPDTVFLKPNDSHEFVVDLRDRLAYTGDFPKGLKKPSYSLEYDELLQEAVKRFQKRHGLKEDGLVNEETIAGLNVPLSERIAQIQHNLERLRWVPRKIPDQYLLVNIPEFRLKIMKKGREMESMKVIVGRSETPTPVMNDHIELITFSPTWFVSDQDFNRVALPRAKKNPDYMNQTGYKLYSRNDKEGASPIDISTVKWSSLKVINPQYRVAHIPGPNDNMKGQVKFVMPNEEDLFLSDASTTSLFDFSYRAFNYGCIAIERPAMLAKYLIGDRKWNIDRINNSMHQSKPITVPLGAGFPIYVVYHTSWVDKNGVLNFRKDLYNYDEKQNQLLEKSGMSYR